jgi:hypothetical protein
MATSFEKLDFEEIQEKNLQDLILTEQRESLGMDFKQQLPEGEQARQEVSKDVVAMANASGGNIVYGLAEKEGGVASKLMSLGPIEGAEKLSAKIQSWLNADIAPSLVGIRIKVVPIEHGGFALVLRIPRSLQSPHAVVGFPDKTVMRYWRRSESQSVPMPEHEIRRTYVSGIDVHKQVDAFRRERIAFNDGTPSGAYLAGAVRVHGFFVPLNSFLSGSVYSYADLKVACEKLEFAEGSYSATTPCLEGAMRHSGGQGEVWQSWHIHRNGVIEWNDAGTNYDHWPEAGNKRRKLLFPRYEHVLGDRLDDVRGAFAKLGLAGPVIFGLSLTDAAGAVVFTKRTFRFSNLMCPVSQVHAHALMLNSVDELVVQNIKPSLDHIMNAFGLPSSLGYGKDGEKLP